MENRKEYQAFLSTLPADIQVECFQWFKWFYSIPKALFLIKQSKLSPIDIDVEQWCKALGMAGEYDSLGLRINLINGVRDNEAMDEKINTEIPLIFVEHSWGKGKGKEKSAPLLIDGNKRLRQAFLKGQKSLQAYYIPKKIAKAALT